MLPHASTAHAHQSGRQATERQDHRSCRAACGAPGRTRLMEHRSKRECRAGCGAGPQNANQSATSASVRDPMTVLARMPSGNSGATNWPRRPLTRRLTTLAKPASRTITKEAFILRPFPCLCTMRACGRKGQTQTPTRARAPARSHQPLGGFAELWAGRGKCASVVLCGRRKEDMRRAN